MNPSLIPLPPMLTECAICEKQKQAYKHLNKAFYHLREAEKLGISFNVSISAEDWKKLEQYMHDNENSPRT